MSTAAVTAAPVSRSAAHDGRRVHRRRPKLLLASLALLAPAWISWVAHGRRDLVSPLCLTALLALNAFVSRFACGVKLRVVRLLQHYVLNPLVRLTLAFGVLPLGIALLETTGRRSGRPRRNPVGEGRDGNVFWIIAEHGLDAGYVRNLQANPSVRVKVRQGLRTRWRPGLAQVVADDDPYRRQRQLCRWHPLRTMNAAMVRVMGTDLVTIRIELT